MDDCVLYYWSYSIDIPGIKPLGQASTFYDVAKDIGLIYYVNMKLECGNVADQDVNQFLLMQAIPSPSDTGNANAKAPDPQAIAKF